MSYVWSSSICHPKHLIVQNLHYYEPGLWVFYHINMLQYPFNLNWNLRFCDRVAFKSEWPCLSHQDWNFTMCYTDWSAVAALQVVCSQSRKEPEQLHRSFSSSCLCPAKLARTCSSTHPNRWAQSIPLSSTSSEAACSFVLTIHKRPFKWRHSVISEILASGLCGIEKREGKRELHWKRGEGENPSMTNQL